MIILRLLLPTLLLSSTAAQNAVARLEWTSCKEDVACFCKHNTDARLAPVEDPGTDTTVDCEAYGAQNKYFTQDSALFQMEIIGGEANAITKTSNTIFWFVAGDKESFGCKRNEKTGEVELVVNNEDKTMQKTYKMKLFEKRSVLEPGHAVCAVYMELAYKYAQKAETERTMVPKAKLVVDSVPPVIYLICLKNDCPETYRTNFYKPNDATKIKCDPFTFQDPSFTKDYHVRPIMHRDKDELNCKNYNEFIGGQPLRTFKMMYDRPGAPEKDMIQLECGDGQMYGIDTGKMKSDQVTKDLEIVPSPESYTFYCAILFNEVCVDPNAGSCVPDGDRQCPTYKKEKAGDPAEYTCPDKKWLINNKYYVLTDEPVCKKEKYGNENDAAFYATLPNSEVKVTSEARCFVNYDCGIKSSLGLPSAKDDAAGIGVDKSDPMVLRCADSKNTLEVIDAKSGVTWNETASYVCDKATGSWQNGTDTIEAGSTVRCSPPPEQEKEKDVDFTMGKMYTIIGGAIGGVVLFIAGGSSLYCLLNNRKHKKKQREKAEWVKLKKPERIKKCIEDLAKAMAATPETYELLLDALDGIEMLLDTRTENLKAWDGAYMFLIRLISYVPKTDQQIWHMLNRYLVIKAQKIINRIGWISKKPITNSKRAGLMRTVAIRLLSLALYEGKNNDAGEMLWKAFRRLGYNGVSQYPHAGVLWSLIMHTRPQKFIQLGHPMKKGSDFDYEDCTKLLREIARKKVVEMPKEDIIPEFGSIQYQAAYAIGATPHTRTHDANLIKQNDPDLRFSGLIDDTHADPAADRDVPLAYFAGLCDTYSRNPALSVLEALCQASKRNANFMKKMWEIKPEADWLVHVKRAQQLVHFYGSSPDAQRLQARFSENPTFAEDLLKMQNEQRDFEAAVVVGKEQLREWLKEKTDRAEFKSIPVYMRGTDENKLDDTVGDFVEPPKGCTELSDKDGTTASNSNAAAAGSNSNSAATGSGSKSSENDPAAGGAAAATPTSPAAAAAVVATPTSPAAAAPAAPAAAAPANP